MEVIEVIELADPETFDQLVIYRILVHMCTCRQEAGTDWYGCVQSSPALDVAL